LSHHNSLLREAAFRRRVVLEAKRRGNISEAAREHRVSRQSVHRWIARYDGRVESLIERSKRPRHHPRQHTPEEVRLVLRVARHNKQLGLVCLWVRLIQRHCYRRSQSALYRVLRREGVIGPPKKKPRRKPKPYEAILQPGERFQVDVKYVPAASLTGQLAGKKLYPYTAIDECTRWRYAAIFTELSTYNSAIFVQKLQKAFPFEIQCIQTDNGAEFTSCLQGAKNPSLFEAYLASQDIRHKRIAVATPRHNGKVERSHRTDGERFYRSGRFFALRYLKEQFGLYLRESNRQPLQAHNWRSAKQILDNYRHVL